MLLVNLFSGKRLVGRAIFERVGHRFFACAQTLFITIHIEELDAREQLAPCRTHDLHELFVGHVFIHHERNIHRDCREQRHIHVVARGLARFHERIKIELERNNRRGSFEGIGCKRMDLTDPTEHRAA